MPTLRRTLPVFLLAVTLAAAARPAAGLVYLTGKLGQTDTAISVGDSFRAVLEGDDSSWGAGVGVNLGRYFALQLEYLDLGAVAGSGSFCPPSQPACAGPTFLLDADSEALALSVLPSYPLTERLWTYLKVGYFTFDTDISGASARDLEEADEDDLLLGIGLRLDLGGPVDLFLEYEELGDVVETVSVGATFSF